VSFVSTLPQHHQPAVSLPLVGSLGAGVGSGEALCDVFRAHQRATVGIDVELPILHGNKQSTHLIYSYSHSLECRVSLKAFQSGLTAWALRLLTQISECSLMNLLV
jgi:hypothetical protein